MRIEPHENLAVLSIRYDVFGPGRLATITPGRVRVVEVQREVPVVQVKVVPRPEQAPPADCQPCDRSVFPGFAPGFTPDPQEVSSQGQAPSIPMPHIARDPDAPPPPEGQIFSRGQAIPGTGGLLDILA